MGDETLDRRSSLLQGVRIVRERWQLILAVAVICLVAAVGLALTTTPSYEASMTLLFSPSELTSVVDSSAPSTADPERELATNLILIQSEPIARRVARELDVADPEELQAQIVAESEPEANLITLTASDADPRRAAAIANAYASVYQEFRGEAARERITEGVELIRRQVSAIPRDRTAQRELLFEALDQLIAIGAVTTGNAQAVGQAAVPTEPSTPRPARDAVLALLLGTALGLALAFLVDLFDRRLKTTEDIEGLYGVQALSTIPRAERRQDGPIALEPYRILSNSLDLLTLNRGPLRTVLVTSAVASEGKTTVARGLASAIALTGQSVILVEVDLRRPTFADHFELGLDERGLTSALVGGTPLAAVLRTPQPALPNLRVLPSGPLPPNAAELLRSSAMSDVLDDLNEMADVLVLDAPPLLPVADAQVLLANPRIDGCLIVARAYATTRDQARRARAVLDRHHRRDVGLVVNGLGDVATAYGYYAPVEPERARKPKEGTPR